MPENVGTCKYEGCKRKALPDSEYCICHSHRDDKDIKAFNKEIEKIMQDKEAEFYDFRGFYFPESFDFEIIYKHLKNRTFERDVNFSYATFTDVNFLEIYFQEKANFSYAKFLRGAYFLNTIFGKNVDFSNVKFLERLKEINFNKAKFKGKTTFYKAISEKPIYFFKSRFEKETNFNEAKFEEVKFTRSEFIETVRFNNAIFKVAKFENVNFGHISDFSDVKFGEKADFTNAVFKETYFADAVFKVTSFNKCKFQEIADFDGAEFQIAHFKDVSFNEDSFFYGASFEEISFNYTTFKGKADFSYWKKRNQVQCASFKIASFHNTTFEKRADFENCEIEEKIDFSYARFHDELSLTNINGYQEKKQKDVPIFDFRNTRFSDKTRIDRGTKLDKAIFNLDNVEHVDFSGAVFPEKIYEERLLEKKFHGHLEENEEEYCPKNWEEVATIYRKLKQAHIKYGISDKAEDFGYREWECKRKSKRETKSFGKYFLYTIFKYWLGYGKNPKQLLYSAIFIIFLFSFLYLGTGIEVYNQEDNIYDVFDNYSAPLEKCFYFSVITFTTVGYGDIHPHGDWARGFTMIEASLGVFMMAFFVATFARRFV